MTLQYTMFGNCNTAQVVQLIGSHFELCQHFLTRLRSASTDHILNFVQHLLAQIVDVCQLRFRHSHES